MARQNEREAIRTIQTYLRHLSYHNDYLSPVPIDGIWESNTQNAVADFQRQNGLNPTGTVDRETWDKLKAAYDKSISLNSPPERIDLFPRSPEGYAVSIGESGFLIDAIQYMLDELTRVYFLPEYKISGEYDLNTANAVSEFQRRNLIPMTGKVDRETWDALAFQHNLLESE